MRRVKSEAIRHNTKKSQVNLRKAADRYAVHLWELRRKYWMNRHGHYVPPLHECTG